VTTPHTSQLAALLLALTSTQAAGQPSQIVTGPVRVGPPIKPPHLSVPFWTPERPPAPGRKLKFKSLREKIGRSAVQLKNRNSLIEISGGVEVLDLDDWRGVAATDIDSGEMCTLSLIGPRAVLLAAHCVDAGLPAGAAGEHSIGAEVVFRTKTYRMTCQLPTAYTDRAPDPWGAPRSSADYALCELHKPVPDVLFETIRTDVAGEINQQVGLLGYGCIELGVNAAGRYTHRDGRANGKPVLRRGTDELEATDITIFPGELALYWRTLSSSTAEPALCFGDSGGPVTAGEGKGRRVLAVNSGLGTAPEASVESPKFYSYLSPLSTQTFVTFLMEWVEAGDDGKGKKDRIVCGFNRPAGQLGCRG